LPLALVLPLAEARQRAEQFCRPSMAVGGAGLRAMSAWERPCLDRRIGPREPLRRAGAAAFVLRRYQSLLVRARGERPPEGAWASDHPVCAPRARRPPSDAAPCCPKARARWARRPVGGPSTGRPRSASPRRGSAPQRCAGCRRAVESGTRAIRWITSPAPKGACDRLRRLASPHSDDVRGFRAAVGGARCPAASLTAQPRWLGAQTVAPEEPDPHARAGGCGPISSRSGGASSPGALSPSVLAWGRARPGPGRPAGRAPGDGTTPAGPSARTSAPGSVPIPGHGVCRRACSLPTTSLWCPSRAPLWSHGQRAVETDGCGRHAT